MAILNIISRHATEAAFLWLLRSMAVNQPHYSLKDLARLDDRLEAHLDGLRIAGDEGWDICKGELSFNEPGEIFTAAVLAFESKKDERIREVLNKALQSPDLLKSVISALGWIKYKDVMEYIGQFWFESEPLLQLIGIAASAVHRMDPPDEVLLDSLKNADLQLKLRALKAAGELGKVNMLPYLQNGFRDEIPLISYYAAKSAVLLGNQNAPYLLKEMLDKLEKPYAEDALRLGIRKMNLSYAHSWTNELKEKPAQLRLAVISAGAAGDPAEIPWIMEMMKNGQIARIAGESFSMITGADLAYENLDKSLPEELNNGPTEDPEDENTELDADENLPMPDPEIVNKWWDSNKSRFKNGTRYLAGVPVASETMRQVLITGYQRQRTQAALELAMLRPGEKLFNTKAPGPKQKYELSVK
ncbi:MAG TPA: TIGR02270 family protein [Ignavibacteriales bacterium]|nr:TIGR02270 family protein [Ignavibacteriales bacterium]